MQGVGASVVLFVDDSLSNVVLMGLNVAPASLCLREVCGQCLMQGWSTAGAVQAERVDMLVVMLTALLRRWVEGDEAGFHVCGSLPPLPACPLSLSP